MSLTATPASAFFTNMLTSKRDQRLSGKLVQKWEGLIVRGFL
jgi:hypothetical protein